MANPVNQFNPNPMPDTLHNNQFTKYLTDPHTREAFLAGCNAIIDVYNTTSADQLAFLSHDRSEERLIPIILRQQKYNTQLRRDDARMVISCANLNKSELRAFLFGFRVNDAGYAVDKTDYAVEDGEFQLIEGHERLNWSNVLARHKQTGAEISREEYDSLSSDQQQNYQLLRYLDLKNDDGIFLKRIVEDNELYLAELLRWDITRTSDGVIHRYLSNCGFGHGDLPVGRFYTFRNVITGAAESEEHSAITPMLAHHISTGHINTLGQYYLALLQSLTVSLTPKRLLNMDAYDLATLKLLLTITPNDLDYYITDKDIMYFRDLNGDGLKGALPSDHGDGWEIVPANDDRCELFAQKNYICEKLIPKVCDVVVQGFCHIDFDNSDVEPRAFGELHALLETIAPGVFEDEDPEEDAPPAE